MKIWCTVAAAMIKSDKKETKGEERIEMSVMSWCTSAGAIMQEVFGGENGRRGLRYLARDVFFYYWISLWAIFLLDVFYWMFFNQASDMAGLNDHTLDIIINIFTIITIVIIFVIIAIIIIITRPKPPFGRQGLAGSWGKDTVRRVHFWVFSTSHFAPSALSSD